MAKLKRSDEHKNAAADRWAEIAAGGQPSTDPFHPNYLLPDWVTPDQKQKFYRAKIRLLDVCEVDEIREFVSSYRASLSASKRKKRGRSTWGGKVPPIDAITVAHVLWALEIEEEAGANDKTRGDAGARALAGPAALLPSDARRGRQVLDGAKKGDEGKYGSKEKQREKRARWQKKLDEKFAARPDLSYRALARIVAFEEGVVERTIRRHTENPRTRKG